MDTSQTDYLEYSNGSEYECVTEDYDKDDDFKDDMHQVSLAYHNLDILPMRLVQYLSERTQTLDLSYNELKDLSFLTAFHNLHTLILDRNPSPDLSTFPTMPKLEILWLNNCNIVNINDWLYMLQVQCPVLKQLSMMSNPVGATTLNGVTENDELQYRRSIIRILPNLVYFDGTIVTDEQRDVPNDSPGFVTVLGRVFNNKLSRIFHLPV